MPSHLKPTCDRSLVEFKVCYQVLEMLVDVDVGSLKFVIKIAFERTVNLTIAHLTIALLGGNPEVGNSECCHF